MYSYKAVLTANYPNGRTHELMVNKNYINNHAYVSVIISKFFSSEPHNKTKESCQSWHENCSATSQHVLQLLGDFVPDALLGLSPWTHWETPVPQTSALPPKFSTAIAASGKFSVLTFHIHIHSYSFIANCQTAVVHINKTKRMSKIYKSQYIFRLKWNNYRYKTISFQTVIFRSARSEAIRFCTLSFFSLQIANLNLLLSYRPIKCGITVALYLPTQLSLSFHCKWWNRKLSKYMFLFQVTSNALTDSFYLQINDIPSKRLYITETAVYTTKMNKNANLNLNCVSM